MIDNVEKNIVAKSDVARDILQTSALFKHSKMVIWEYVENGISYRDSDVTPKIRVKIDKQTKTIVITDNGRGMDIEDLQRFFTAHAENFDRQQERKVRGKHGTGGLSALGIAESLTVESVKDGKQNTIKLTRKYLSENSGRQELPLENIAKDKLVNQANGTKITIKDVQNPSHLVERPIIEHIETKLRLYSDAEIKINNHLCEYQEPAYISKETFKPESEFHKQLGDIELYIYVSSQNLPTDKQGIAISATSEIHESNYNSVQGKDFCEKIFGYVDVPLLDDEKAPPAFDQSRSGKLNPENNLVKNLYSFIFINVEKVRKELENERKNKKKEEEIKKFQDLDKDVSNIINEHFKQFSSEFAKTNSQNTGGRDFSQGEIKDMDSDDVQEGETLVSGGNIPASYEETEFLGETDNSVYPNNHQHNILREDSVTPNSLGSKIKEGIQKKPKGGFSVKPDHLGEEQKRAVFKSDERTIYINLDHPQLSAAYKLCDSNVDDEIFKRLYYEIAFLEYVIALIFLKEEAGHYRDSTDALADTLEQVDKVARNIAQLYS